MLMKTRSPSAFVTVEYLKIVSSHTGLKHRGYACWIQIPDRRLLIVAMAFKVSLEELEGWLRDWAEADRRVVGLVSSDDGVWIHPEAFKRFCKTLLRKALKQTLRSGN